MLKAVLVTGEIAGWGRGGQSCKDFMGALNKGLKGEGNQRQWIIGFKLTDKNKIVCMIS